MDDQKNYSRHNKYDKRRKTTKSISVLLVIAGILAVILIALFIFGGDDEDDQSTENDSTSAEETASDENADVAEETDIEGEDEDATENDEAGDSSDGATEDEDTAHDDEEVNEDFIIIEDIPEEEIDDPNVIEAYTANWQPIGTVQEEPHELVFSSDSDDWQEMINAIGYALKLEQDEITIHWLGNGGDQQRANGYVQSTITNEHYTVYLVWIENEGWKPEKVERVERFIHPNQATEATTEKTSEEQSEENNGDED